MDLDHLHYSCLSFLSFQLSWVTAGYFPAHSNPPCTRQDYISYYFLSSLYFISLGKFITYQSWILWSRLTRSCFSHPWLHQVHDWNIQSCHGWWRHPWLQSSWHTYPFFLFVSEHLFIFKWLSRANVYLIIIFVSGNLSPFQCSSCACAYLFIIFIFKNILGFFQWLSSPQGNIFRWNLFSDIYYVVLWLILALTTLEVTVVLLVHL